MTDETPVATIQYGKSSAVIMVESDLEIVLAQMTALKSVLDKRSVVPTSAYISGGSTT